MFGGLEAYGRTLLVSNDELERSKALVRDYKLGKIPEMNEQLWRAKKSMSNCEAELTVSC
jgi:hypothetical protein